MIDGSDLRSWPFMPLPSWPPVPLATGTMENATNFPGPPKGGEDECGKNYMMFFPTCQVRVVRFFVSCPPPPPLFLLLLFLPLHLVVYLLRQCDVPDLNHDLVSSVWRAGPQPRSCEFSVACRTPTAILWVQCGLPDPNREHVSSVWRAGPQPRSCEFSVACRTSSRGRAREPCGGGRRTDNIKKLKTDLNAIIVWRCTR